MNRDEWEVEFAASSLALAAAAQRDFRLQRLKVWEAKKEEVMAKIKSAGLTIHEGPAAQMGRDKSYGSTYTNQGAHVMVDATLQKDLDECVDKIRAHRDASLEYDAWVQFLRAGNNETRLKLRLGDWLYFFGKL
jgi:hypothetical protein